jgi:hypothetical protein
LSGNVAAMRSWGGALKVGLIVAVGLVSVAVASAAPRDSAPTPRSQSQSPAARGILCMPKPSACGFPDLTNTGVTPGTPLATVNGVVTLSTPGQVFENREVRGSIIVTAPNVTIRNVRVINADPYYVIGVKNNNDWDNSDANLLLDHVEINFDGHPDVKGIAFNGFTARHVLFHNGADCAHFGVNVVIEDSMCVLGPDANGDGNPDPGSFCDGPEHFDGFQSDGGSNITLRHNTIRNPCHQTSAILMSTNTSPIDRVVIDNNLMSGGGYTVYCGTADGVATHQTYTNNVFSREFFPNGGYWGRAAYCEDVDVSGRNVWDGDYVPPPTAGAGGGTTGGSGGDAAGGGTGATPGVSYFLSKARARKLARTALRRELKRRFTRRAKTLRASCRRRSRSTVACSVRWASRTGRRYRGSVTVTRVSAQRWRYSLRIRSGSKRFKRTGRL